MEAAQIIQRIGVTLAHSLLSEARKPIGVNYESDQGVDMTYTLCSVFYIHLQDLQNLVNMPVDLWVSVVYKLNESGEQDVGFAVTHHKEAPCELKTYPLGSIEHAVEVIKKFFAYSMLPYFEMRGAAQTTDLTFLAGKYGNAQAWGDTVTLNLKAEDFHYDVDYTGGVFRGFSDRLLNNMINDVQTAIGKPEELKHRVFSLENDIGVVFIPKSTYSASKYVPKEL
jgi:hypothetical protein